MSICDRCIHDEVCGLEGNHEEALVFCAYKMPKIGHWRHYEGMLICSKCGAEYYDEIMEYCGDDVPKCCPNCGCRMVESQESEILDKIRTEIKSLQNANPSYWHSGDMVDREEVLDIIDKYTEGVRDKE